MKKSLLALSIALGITLTGCGGKDPKELVELAKQKIEQGDDAAAIVNLKNALQETPQDANVRFLLGKTYADRGAYNQAIKELEFAQSAGYEKEDIYPYLAAAYYHTSNSSGLDSLKNMIDQLPDNVKVPVLVYDGMLSLDIGSRDLFLERRDEAKSLVPNHELVKVMDAYAQFSAGQVELAKQTALTVEQNDEVQFLLGQLYMAEGALDKAVQAFEEYTSAKPEYMRGAIFLANAYVKTGQYDDARKLITNLLDVSPNQPFVNYLQAIVAYNEEDFTTAQNSAEKAIQNGYDFKYARATAGLSAFRLGNSEQAYDHLSVIKNTLSPESPLLKLYATLSIELGYVDEGAELLTQQQTISEEDVLLLSAASAELVRLGKLDSAKSLSAKTKNIPLDDETLLLTRGLAQLNVGDMGGLSDLEEALQLNQESPEINTVLARVYLENELYEQALELARKWQSDNPEDASGYALEALAFEKQGNVEAAEAAFKEALALNSANTAARVYFADKAYKEGNVEKAISELIVVVDKGEPAPFILEKVFMLHHEQGTTDEGLLLLKSTLAETNNEKLRLIYAKALGMAGNHAQAVEVLQKIEDENKTEAHWLVLGNSLFKNGQTDKALELSQRWIDTAPDSAIAHLRHIMLLDMTGEHDKALSHAVRSASRLNDSNLNILLIDLAARRNDVKLARKTLDRLADNVKTSIPGRTVQLQTLIAEGRYQESARSGLNLYNDNPTDRLAWLASKALIGNGESDKALDLYLQHADGKELSQAQLLQLAELAVRAGNKDLAITYYNDAISASEGNVKALNNAAYLLSEKGEHAKALDYSSRALEIEPDAYSFLDTRVTVLLNAGKHDEAITVMDKMYAMRPNDKVLLEKLANTLEKQGYREKATALRELL